MITIQDMESNGMNFACSAVYLPSFYCAKCGKDNPQVRYCNYRGVCERGDFHEGEILHLTCSRCGYRWNEPPLDARRTTKNGG